jgi:glycosyltransferase involved in cell wall biosynthesis
VFDPRRGVQDQVMSAAPQRWQVLPQLEAVEVAPPAAAPAPRISFIVPVFNEVKTVGEVLERLDALGIDAQIIAVDDGSWDGTASLLDRWAAEGPHRRVIHQPNRGKGAAVRAAIPYVDREIVVVQDADMEYDPADVPTLVEPIARGVADVVYGSRLSGGRPQRAYLFWHLVGNRFLSLLTNVLFNTTLSDMETGYKAFRADVLRSLVLTQDDFAIEPEITAKICARKLRIYEVPIAYYGRTYSEGKKITWTDGVKAVKVLVAVRLRG